MDTAVYVNSTFVGEWKYGYPTFEFDITPSLREGVNEVSVRIDYRYLNSRWYSGAGIFRNVWWISRGSSFITPDGIYITPVEDANGRWKVEVDTELELHRAGAYFLEQKIFEKGIPERVIASDSKEIAVQKEDRADVKAEQTLLLEEAPRLWDLEEGNLYELETSLYFGEALLEKEVQTFGFRTLQFDPKRHAPVTIGSNFMKWENPQECAKELDCVGYNYSEYLYEEHHREHPDWVIYGSETASVLASRSIYHFPLSRAILTDEDEQCSALGNSITGWGAKSYEGCICDDRDKPFSMVHVFPYWNSVP